MNTRANFQPTVPGQISRNGCANRCGCGAFSVKAEFAHRRKRNDLPVYQAFADFLGSSSADETGHESTLGLHHYALESEAEAWPLTGPRKDRNMFSIRQKREIAEKVQKILRETNHPELPKGEIAFSLHVNGAEAWSWADIRNNGSVAHPEKNPWNELQDRAAKGEAK